MSNVEQYDSNEEIANTLTHAIGAIFSIIGLVYLLAYNDQENTLIRIISFSIYGSSLILLFTASTIYHWLVNPQEKKLFKLLDHCAIYVLIAGTYTPLMLLTLQGVLGYSMLLFIWIFAVGGIVFKIKFGHKYKKVSLATYLGMGFIALSIIQKLYLQLSTSGIILLAIGGLVYSLGVIFYVQKKIPFNHAIWHLFVLGGATCHFFMIWHYV